MELLPALKPACSSAIISAWGLSLFKMIFSMTLSYSTLVSRGQLSGARTKWIRCSPFTQQVKGSTSTSGTYSNGFFSETIDQDIRTQYALSLAVGDCSVTECRRWRPLKNRQNCTCVRKNTTNTTRTDARRRVCVATVPFRLGNVVTII